MQTRDLLLAVGLLTFLPTNIPAMESYVDANSVNPIPPYTNWGSAAVTIQAAVDAAVAGDQILVTNGVYRTGGRVVYGAMTNRVVVDKAVLVQSVNGPEMTVIQGYQVPGTTNGDSAVRCVYLANGAGLMGFTVANGATRSLGDAIHERSGGGVWCESTNAIVSNCRLLGNSAGYGGSGFGGGAYSGSLHNCSLLSNSVGIYGLGGGAFNSTLDDCMLTGNSARHGGGAYTSRLNNCILSGNSALGPGNPADGSGGGAYFSTLNNCTLVGNSARVSGGGTDGGTLDNCIIYYNTAPIQPNAYSSLFYCCTTPLPEFGSTASITNAPLFVDQAGGNFHVQSNSPCINSGANDRVPTGPDLEGNPRIAGGTVDIGAFEFQSPSSVLSYSWTLQYGFPTDGSADYADPDVDGFNNWQEWIAGADPTNALSGLRILSLTPDVSGVRVSWQSVKGRGYWLERGNDLGGIPPFSLLSSNVTGQAGTTSYTDTNAVGDGPFFYRVGVHQ